MVGVCSFGEGGRLVGIKLYPFTFAHELRSKTGIPMLADPETGRKIIDYLGKLSAPLGTKIEYKESIGFVHL